ncbi:MAG: trehalose-6-phosphate synthase [Candidatus Omnitrophica bacterium]|nr:trehalose-6-phosphate synthase [Candidatus Omnitrophota bacterium]
MWTKESLEELIKTRLEDYLLIVVSNREPYVHTLKKGKVVCQKGAGGVITALDPVMRTCKGIWIAQASGEADRKVADREGKVKVPPEEPLYELKRVWLSKEEDEGYYYGFSNEALWPLCHMAFIRPIFRESDWEYYKKVNEKFAKAVLEETKGKKAFVWIQDYHLALLPKYLKEAQSNIITAHFWHIPWPGPDVFRIAPHRQEILEGLLANDLLGFHIRYNCDNFLGCVDRELEAKIDRERYSVIKGGHETLIRPYPISVDFLDIARKADFQEVQELIGQLREEFSLNYEFVCLGLDRIDYTKGIPERLQAVGRFLDKYPQYRERFVFIQMGEISRLHIPQYKLLNDELNALVEKINWKYATEYWSPIVLVRRHLSYPELLAFYRLGNLCIVSSLHDGMNLVSKEFVSARVDLDGVLLLSQFTGAARELTDSILINPYDTEEFADKIYQAVNLSREEREKRMLKMRKIVEFNNIYRWAGKVISELLKFEFKE